MDINQNVFLSINKLLYKYVQKTLLKIRGGEKKLLLSYIVWEICHKVGKQYRWFLLVC